MVEVSTTNEIKNLCACGCGEEIPFISKKGKPQKFKNHHNIKHKGGSTHPSWKGGRRITGKVYTSIWKPDHPFADKEGYVKEHRLVMEKHLGRYLRKDEIVHHINKDTNDNRIENLQLMTHSQHSSHHRIEELVKRRKEILSRKCFVCGSNKTPFNKHERHYIWRRHPFIKTEWLCNKCYIAHSRGRIAL